jgi:protease-4
MWPDVCGMQTEAPHSFSIDRYVVPGLYEIEEQWGWAQLVELTNEMFLLRTGVPYSELGISKRREDSMPAIISASGDRNRVVYNPQLLQDEEQTPAGSFALLKLNGVMRSNDGMSSRGVGSLIRDLNAAYDNQNIDGILIEANTGGGESLAGTMLQSAIEESPKPVVVYAHMLASAGVRGTLAADEIIASGPGAQIGSIGTYITLDKDFARYYTRWYEELYADKSTNKNKDFREYLKGNMEPLRQSINRSNDNFLKEVQQYRPLRGDVENTLSGELFYAKDAKSRGLVDGVGSFQYAVQRLSANVRRRAKM